CSRCSIPIAMQAVMPVAQMCPCGDIDSWPNDELPAPHMPINNNTHFQRLKTRLNDHNRDDRQVDIDYDVDHDTDNGKASIINGYHQD
ncbi:MAG: hypothetical protein AAGA83_09500, partial [Cyanobacteria bacterium P01_F01_bin.116]